MKGKKKFIYGYFFYSYPKNTTNQVMLYISNFLSYYLYYNPIVCTIISRCHSFIYLFNGLDLIIYVFQQP